MRWSCFCCLLFFFFNDTATTEIYTLSLHDALPIWSRSFTGRPASRTARSFFLTLPRSEEHTSELQSRRDLVCRLLLEKKKKYGVLEYILVKREGIQLHDEIESSIMLLYLLNWYMFFSRMLR